MDKLAWLYWNPNKTVFTIPFLDRPIAWYGVLFVIGFIIAYLVLIPIFNRFLIQSRALSPLDVLNWPLLVQQLQDPKNRLGALIFAHLSPSLKTKISSQLLNDELKNEILKAINQVWDSNPQIERKEFEEEFAHAIAPVSHTSHAITDRLCWFVVAGTIIGARLGSVFFYEWSFYKENPQEIIKIWNGGLASHGGTIGVFISLYLFTLYIKKTVPSLTLLSIMDSLVIVTPLATLFIRLGNFVNQEILGTKTDVFWAVIFGNPVDGSAPAPRHPVQLYEALSLLLIFILLYSIWKKGKAKIGSGLMSGLMFVLIFSSRFILEFWKETQESIIDSSVIQMGQLLSLPFIVLGIYLILRSLRCKTMYVKRTCFFS